jgi:energy-coupling factor transporter ATP-binding protein EcfA2
MRNELDNLEPREREPQARGARPNGGGNRLVFKTVAQFCDEYIPLEYAVDGVIRTGSLYTLTGPTGSGKTAFNVIAALAHATGREDILGRPVTRGRTAYCVAENPDDARMRFMIAAFLLNIDLDEIADDLLIYDKRASPEELIAELGRLGPFVYICVDTLAAFYDGKNISDPVEGGNFTRRWRPRSPADPPSSFARTPSKEPARAS